ncbi:MAG TPA: SpvB/TcaC N-terminal domain-containing protein [Thermoanaerobaculia bacterium]|nr:SpvB/TcaC N-terminal domain-containing protein [Thermoanaerobaculia bacterium]
MRHKHAIGSLFLAAVVAVGGLALGRTGWTGGDPLEGARLRRVVPVRAELLSGPGDPGGGPPGEAWRLFDGETERGLTAREGEPVRVRADLSGSRTIAAVGVFGPAEGRLTVLSGEAVLLAGADLSGLSGWHRFTLAEPVAVRSLTFEWQPSAPGAVLPEVELWGGSGKAEDDLVAAATPQVREISAGAEGVFRFRLEPPPGTFARAFLTYELEGLPHWSAAVRSINGLPSRGGFGVSATEGGLQVEEINPRWLRRGVNEIRFLPASAGGLPPSGAESLEKRSRGAGRQSVPYTVRNLRLVLVEDGGRPVVTDPASATPGPSGAAARLVDGSPATGWDGSGETALVLPFRRAAQPFALEVETAGRPEGALEVELLRRDGGAVPAREAVDLGALKAGRHTLSLAEGLPAGVALRLSWSGGGDGQIAEAGILASPAGPRRHAPRLVLAHPLKGEHGDAGAYLRGFVEPAPAELFVDGVPVAGGIAAEDGAFGVFVPRPGDAEAWDVALEVVFPGGDRLRRTVRLGRGSPDDPENGGDDHAELDARPGEAKAFGLGKARLEVPADALARPVKITMRRLGADDLPALDAGMTNVTAGRGGLRMGPHGLRFEKPVRLEIPYDASLLPAGMTDADVRTFYFDEEAGRWFPVPRLEVKAGGAVVVSTTDHFTDFINATLTVPEEPSSANFSPNSIGGLAAADPASEIELIEPPDGDSRGSAALRFPLRLPPGRAGLEPELAVTYDSDRSEGWLGMGWDLMLPSVDVSTLFGVPRYDPAFETETYFLSGEQLAPVADPAQPVARQSERSFVRRVEGAFERIVRHGSRPDDFWWEVTDKDGVRYQYGRTSQARLADPATPHNTFRWLLERAVDLHGNTVDYAYTTDSGNDGEPWVEIYPARIDYTGRNGAGAFYQVRFELDEGNRPDQRSTGMPGFKVKARHRLAAVDVLAGGGLVRRYRFHYREGDFRKSLLEAMSVTGDDGETEFYRHAFDYFRMPVEGDGYDGFEEEAAWGRMASSGDATESRSFGAGGHVFVGLGGPGCSIHGGVQVGANFGDTTTRALLLDVNGDGLPDRIDESGRVDLNRYDPGADAGGFLRTDFSGASSLSHTEDLSFDFGAGLHAAGDLANLGASWVWSHSNDDRAVADVNGDGLPDLLSTAGGFSARINTGSGFEELSGWAPPEGRDLSVPGQREEVLGAFKLSDPLRKLVLPYSGRVAVTGAIQKRAPGGDDGVVASLWHNGSRIWLRDFAPDDTGACEPGPGGSCGGGLELDVAAGDRLYFLASAKEETSADDLLWAPRVTYTGRDPEAVEPYGASVFTFDAAADFRLAGPPGGGWVAPASGRVRVLGALTKQATSDDVVASVLKGDGTVVWSRALGAFEEGTFDEVPEIAVAAEEVLTFRIASDGPFDPDRVRWTPTVTYEGGEYCRPSAPGQPPVCGSLSCGPDPVSGGETCELSGLPGVSILPEEATRAAQVAVDVHRLLPLNRPTVSWVAPEAGDYTFDLSWNGPGPLFGGSRVILYVQGVHRLLGKLEVPAGQPNAPFSVTASLAAGERVFVTALADEATGLGTLSAQAGGHSVPVNLRYRNPEGDVLSGGWHGWHYGEWNGAVAFSEGGLSTESEDFVAATPRWDGVSGVAEPVWQGAGFDLYLAAEGVKPSRRGMNASRELSRASGGSGPGLLRKTWGRTATIEASVGVGVSRSAGTNETQLDLLDLNGDRYADQVADGAVLFSNGRDGFGAWTSIPGLGGPVRRIADGTFSASIGLGSVFSKKDGGGKARAVASTLPSIGASTSRSQVRTDLVDVNGDGLPDRVSMASGGDALEVHLNLGYRFGGAERWPLPQWSGSGRCREAVDLGSDVLLGDVDSLNSLSLTSSAALQAGASFGPFGGGVATTLARTVVEMADVNGDGLADHVSKEDGDPFFRVKINRGDGWEPESRWSVPGWSASVGDGYNPLDAFRCLDSLSFNGNVEGFGSAGAPICIPLVPPVPVAGLQIEVSVQGSGGAGGVQLLFEDVDGDGLSDHVLKKQGDPNLYVKRNKARKVNLLSSVTRPLGGAIALDYRRQGNRVDRSDPAHLVDLPNNQWALASTTVDDGRGNAYTTTFDYGNDGFYDRAERTPYGYARVRATLPDGSTVERTFHNQDFFRRGLPVKETMADASGRLFTVTTRRYEPRPVAPGSVFPAVVEESSFFYEGTTASEAAFRKATRETFEYDSLGNLVRHTDFADEGEDDDLATTVAYQVDPSTGVVRPGTLEARDGAGRLLRRRTGSYDERGNLVRLEQTLVGGRDPETGAPYTGSKNAVRTLVWDDAGNLASSTDPSGFTRTFAWDPDTGTYPAQVSGSFGYVSRFTHDLKHGKPTLAVDENGNAIRSVYDGFGRLLRVVGPEDSDASPALSFEYGHTASPAWTLARHKDATRPDTIDNAVFIDGLGRTIQTREDADLDLGSGTATRTGVKVSGRLEFDARGRVAAEGQPVFDDGPVHRYAEVPQKNPTRMEHDVLDRARVIRFPHGAETRIDYGFGSLDGVERFLRTRTDGNGRAARAYFDVEQELLATEQPNTIGGARKSLVTRYGYDALSQLLSVTDPKGNATRLEWDTLGHNVVLDSPDAGRTEYRWDLAGNLGAKITANLAARGRQIRYLYTFNRLDRIDYPESPDVVFTWGGPGAPHNRANRVASVADESGTEERFFDRLGNIVRTVKTATALNGGTPKGPYVTESRYDSFGRLLGVVYPDGEDLTYTFDAAGKLKAAAGLLGGVRTDYLVHQGYDELGDRVRAVYGNGVETRFSYDPVSRFTTRLETRERSGRELQDLRYTHDRIGILTRLDNDVEVPPPSLRGGPTSQTFRYDDLYQLVSAEGTYRTGPNKTSTYSLATAYDEIGNVTAKQQVHNLLTGGGKPNLQKKTSFDWTYAYGGPKPHAPTHIGDRTFTYDASGNQAGWNHDANGTRRTLTWDEENRLKAVADNGQTTRFLYNSLGDRTNKAGQHGETIYVNPLYSVRNGAIGTKHVWADDIRLASKVDQDKLYFLHPDHLGSTQFVTDATGEVYQHLEYFPSGEVWADESSETQRNPYLFSGKELDEETGLSYFGARYYDARPGQWISPDPILDEMLDVGKVAEADTSLAPTRPNGYPYSYAGNDPVDLGDPQGLAKGKAPGLKPFKARIELMGATPTKKSAVGIAVRQRMQKQGLLRNFGTANEEVHVEIDHAGTMAWKPLDANIHMGHRIDAVSFWNRVGRYFGPKSTVVRNFMKDPSNYELEWGPLNSSNGASLHQNYGAPNGWKGGWPPANKGAYTAGRKNIMPMTLKMALSKMSKKTDQARAKKYWLGL